MLVDAGLDPTALLGYSQSAIDGRRTATVYLNRFLGGDDSELYYNDRYPTSMDKLTDEHVSGDLLKKFLSHFGLWLATNRHKSKNSSNPLNVSALEDYFKFAKEVLKHKFGSHELFNRGNIDWWNELRGKFVTEATRCKKNDQETAIATPKDTFAQLPPRVIPALWPCQVIKIAMAKRGRTASTVLAWMLSTP